MTVKVVLKRKVSLKRILFASIIGTISTLIIFIPINRIILLILKILTGFIMCLVAFKYQDIKYFFNNIIYLYMCSVILAGMLYFLKIEFNNLAYVISLLLAPLILFVYIIQERNLKKLVNFRYPVTITFKNNQTLNLTALIDTGNKLIDPITNKYIIIINKKRLKGIYNIRSPMYVVINTVNKTSLLECISIKNIIVNNKVYNNYLLGLSEDFKSSDGVECLLNEKILEDM